MSKLLRKACEEAKESNKNIVNKVRHIGNKFLNAVYLVLQMSLRRSSQEFQHINIYIINCLLNFWCLRCGVYSRAAFNNIFACCCGVYLRVAFTQGRRLVE